VFNASSILNFSPTLSDNWPFPDQLQQPRMVKFDFKMNF
jgi:hypothetical protein